LPRSRPGRRYKTSTRTKSPESRSAAWLEPRSWPLFFLDYHLVTAYWPEAELVAAPIVGRAAYHVRYKFKFSWVESQGKPWVADDMVVGTGPTAPGLLPTSSQGFSLDTPPTDHQPTLLSSSLRPGPGGRVFLQLDISSHPMRAAGTLPTVMLNFARGTNSRATEADLATGRLPPQIVIALSR
jgi:hypothetical protein